MISLKVSTPGKVILFGEHAVVYGKTAVAASLNRRTSLELRELPTEDPWIHVEMQKLGMRMKVPLQRVRDDLLLGASRLPLLEDVGHDEFYKRVQLFVSTLGWESEREKISLECFFYALAQIIQTETLDLKPFAVKISSELPIGAGLGSSASFSVSLVAGFLHWSRLQRSPDAKLSPAFDSSILNRLSRYAQNCERIMHGTPSGIDNSICTFGSIIEFRRNEAPTFIRPGSNGLRILLVDTKVDRSTKLLVSRLAGLADKYPQIFHKIIEAIDEISKLSVSLMKEIQGLAGMQSDRLHEAYKELSMLVTANQGLLSSCQVSHLSLDLICTTASTYGFSAKLTGAGGGGFAYVLIPPNASDVRVQDLTSELIKNGFSVIETILGGTGVEIHAIDNDNQE